MQNDDPRNTRIQVKVPSSSMSTPLDSSKTSTALRVGFLDHVVATRGKELAFTSPRDRFIALALAVRHALAPAWARTQEAYAAHDTRRVCYLSAEFLLGRLLQSNLVACGLEGNYRQLLGELGINWDELVDEEPEAALGNGGLGRLAACLLDSLATLEMPAFGHGIRYEFGLFEQRIVDGFQIEDANDWLRFVNPWEIERADGTTLVHFYGRAEEYVDAQGAWRVRWVDTSPILGVPYDTPVIGFGVQTVNTLRLWSARATRELAFEPFNRGDYVHAVEQKDSSELLSKVLYPADDSLPGRELRLKQEYFLVACAMHDVVEGYVQSHVGFDDLPNWVAFQLNDTHPALTVAELMRVLVDRYEVPWDKAWMLTRASCSFTNHTLMNEALERWPIDLFARVLPRHLQIVYEINRRLLDDVRARFPGDEARVRRVSLIEDEGGKRVRMASLATVGSHTVNGVAPIHSELVRAQLLRDFAELGATRFTKVTNGVTPRRWLLLANPGLARILTSTLGEGWPADLQRVAALSHLAGDSALQGALARVKRDNKVRLADWARRDLSLTLDVEALFDVHAKRFHEYKRQVLSALHAVVLYGRALQHKLLQPRVLLYSGKAAPGYRMAKLILRLVTGIAARTQTDTREAGLTVAFLPNYGVSLAELLVPAADLSEQISTAGTEASGTSNMKLAMNGALTVGTLDGANIDLRAAVGEDHFFAFGMTADEVARQRAAPVPAKRWIDASPELGEALERIAGGHFGDRGLFAPIVDRLCNADPYFVLADYADYAAAQERASARYRDRTEWGRSVIKTIASSGPFSSDRAARDYCQNIWRLQPRSLGAR
jgi:starch phosphorylase